MVDIKTKSSVIKRNWIEITYDKSIRNKCKQFFIHLSVFKSTSVSNQNKKL